ncbi:Fe-S cluster assembly sulfur transfer protein SufU [Candidatus Berkiella aquae]|uniref:NifU-like protein n=1 Tax=Candidatus Berkiella aquae TaxID=295108 RepID=A0A0Q9YKW4_9GAMM|nr:SUF system NifU family Fe-S cluster assembly protein [Candidatus Berkiella aquae]MCS5710895.1 SUF system NifU family Fe-S cluster assembly protein [Candidatus Berkiella aquae]
MSELSARYQEILLDHGQHPRHFGELKNPTHAAFGSNPLCEDDIKIYLILTGQAIKAIQFTGSGCHLCIASASLLTEHLQNKTVLEAQDCFAAFLQLLENNVTSETSALGKLTLFKHIHHLPLKVKCATLPWQLLKVALIKEPQEENSYVRMV